jgi:hypothetical protein
MKKKTGQAGKHADDAGARERAAKLKSLMDKREQELPNESFEDRFREVANTKAGEELFMEMHRPEAENFGNLFAPEAGPSATVQGKEEAKAIFLTHVHELSKMGLTWEQSLQRAKVEEPGKSAWLAWRSIKGTEVPEDHPAVHEIRQRKARIESTPAYKF